MLQFKRSDTEATIILTLTENVSLESPYYLFVFTHVLTKDVVVFVKSDVDDQSGYKNRFNQFVINPSELFEGKQVGEWHYIVYEQQNENTDTALTGEIIERGKLMLERETEFVFNKYETATSYKTYNG
jgi:hypothetical protein